MMIKYISLFSGIGGFEYGIDNALEKLGIEGECVFSSEINKYARQIYEKNFGVEPYGDITKISERNIPDHELLVGGFPCQAFSIAGTRGGFDDTRGTLFFEIARIARHKRPKILLLENVRGLLSHNKGRTFETILKTLDNIGYNVEWQVLNSKNYGVPQNRERVFIIGHLRRGSLRTVFPISRENTATLKKIVDGSQGNRVYTTDGISCTIVGTAGGLGAKTGLYKIQPIAVTGDILIEKEITNCLDANYYKGLGCNQQRTGVMLIREATKIGFAEARPGDSVNYSIPNSKTRRGRVGNGIANTLDTGSQQGVVTNDVRIRRLTPIECERLQGFPDDFSKYGVKDGNIINISDNQRYKCIGNAVSIPVVETIIEKLFCGNV